MTKPTGKRAKQQLYQNLFRGEVMLHRALLHLAQRMDSTLGLRPAAAITIARGLMLARLREVLKEQREA